MKIVKDRFTSTNVMEDIWEYINRAKLIIADVSGHNSNVLYEVGIAHTIGKRPILLYQKDDDIKFDVSQTRHCKYSPTKPGLNVLEKTLKKSG